MTLNIVENPDGTTTVTIDFIDEDVELQCETTAKGDTSAALAYLPFFAQDMRRNFADLFPLPETPEGGIEI
jgi:hypothetical protein